MVNLDLIYTEARVEVIGDRKELQKVFDAYDRLRVSLESYDASVEGVIEMDKRVVKGKYDISKRGSLYSLSTVSQNIPSEGTPPIDIAHEHYLDSSRGYHVPSSYQGGGKRHMARNRESKRGFGRRGACEPTPFRYCETAFRRETFPCG